MGDHHRMHGVAHQVGVAEGLLELRALVAAAGAEHVPRRVHGAQRLEVSLQSIGERVVSGIHVGEQGVAAVLRQLPGHQDRAHGRHLVVGMIGVPAAADVELLIGLLANLGDLRVAGVRLEELVDVDGTPALGEGDVLLGRDALIAKEDHAELPVRIPDALPVAVRQLCQIDAQNLRPATAAHAAHRQLAHPDCLRYPSVRARIKRCAARNVTNVTLHGCRHVLPSPPPRILERNAWFTGLSPSLQAALRSEAESHQLAAGEWVYGSGDAPRGVFALLEGAALVYVALARGDDVLVHVALPGEIFGHAARLGRGPRLATVLAARPTTLLYLSESALERVARGRAGAVGSADAAALPAIRRPADAARPSPGAARPVASGRAAAAVQRLRRRPPDRGGFAVTARRAGGRDPQDRQRAAGSPRPRGLHRRGPWPRDHSPPGRAAAVGAGHRPLTPCVGRFGPAGHSITRRPGSDGAAAARSPARPPDP